MRLIEYLNNITPYMDIGNRYIFWYITTKILLITTKTGGFTSFLLFYTIKNIVLTNKRKSSTLMLLITF